MYFRIFQSFNNSFQSKYAKSTSKLQSYYLGFVNWVQFNFVEFPQIALSCFLFLYN